MNMVHWLPTIRPVRRAGRGRLAVVAVTAALGVIGIAWSVSHTPPFENDTGCREGRD
jgi:hypothetical protein